MSLGKINAMANISDQTKDQRAAFSKTERTATTSELGANRTSHLLFADSLTIDPDSGNITMGTDEVSVNQLAEASLTSLYVQGVVGPANPDFQGGHQSYNYSGATDMLESTRTQSDLPNTLGPNLIPPTIDESGEVSTTTSTSSASSPIIGRGFGVKLTSRQDPGNFTTLGSYLSRRRNSDGVIILPKGEFTDDEKYNWEA